MTELWGDLSRPPLRALPLRQALTSGESPAWHRLDVVAETGSTNADLAGRARTGEPEGAVLVADHQSAGRGRRDRTWVAPPRAGLAVSVLLRPAEHRVPADRWSWLTLLAGVAVTDALIRVCGLQATLKWPNDVLVPLPEGEPGKVAGLLAEVIRTDGTSDAPGVVLGLGINVTQEQDELPVPTATSLRLAGSAVTDRDTVLKAVLRSLAHRYQDFVAAEGDPTHPASGLAAVYRERCSTIGRVIQAQLPDGTSLQGLADGVDDEGRLLVRELPDSPDSRVHVLSAGDVVHIRPAEPA
jgi:BirA family biotin operon repressor/biotin-[acetyl-CoA-carboxylase] ligase